MYLPKAVDRDDFHDSGVGWEKSGSLHVLLRGVVAKSWNARRATYAASTRERFGVLVRVMAGVASSKEFDGSVVMHGTVREV